MNIVNCVARASIGIKFEKQTSKLITLKIEIICKENLLFCINKVVIVGMDIKNKLNIPICS